MNQFTRNLIKLVQRRAGEPTSLVEARSLIEAGADITVQVDHRSMIDVVIEEEQRVRSTPSVWKAGNCRQLIDVLQRQASRLLAVHIISATPVDLTVIRRLIVLHANTYQAENYGALGLLGHFLQQSRSPISIDIVRLLIEHDSTTHAGLTAENDAGETCLSIAKANPNCSPEVTNYLQNTFDRILNRAPHSQPPIPVDEVISWIQRGANPEMADETGNTVLFHAVQTNNLALVNALVSFGCNTSHMNAQRLTPLSLAQRATPRNPELIAALESQNANRELQKLIKRERSQLTIKQVVAALDRGANINARIADQGSFLHLLIDNNGTPAMVTAFVNEFKADISIMDSRSYRAIEKCILTDQPPYTLLQTFLTLPNTSATLFFNSKLNRTLLQFANEHRCTGATTVIQRALDERLWLLVVKCALVEKHIQQLISSIKEFVQHGAQIDHLHTDDNYHMWTLVHFACQKGNKTLLQFLIQDVKASYSLPNGSGDVPIAIAAEYGHLSIVEYLWTLPDSSLNVQNKNQQTPLHLAVKNQHLPVVRFLVRWGADPQTRDSRQRTPLDLAKAHVPNNPEETIQTNKLVNFLQQLICPSVAKPAISSKATRKTADPRQDDCELVTLITIQPLHMDDTDPERRGMQKPNILSGTLNDQLHDAARHGDLMAAEKLLRQGADIGYQKNGHTAHQIAQQTAHECYSRLPMAHANYNEYQLLQQKMQACQAIAQIIEQMAVPKLIEAIGQSKTGLVVAYHLAGAPLTPDLIYRACSTSDDNVEIIYYLSHQTLEMFQALYQFDRSDSPYQIAKKKKFYRVASYIKYLLSVECTKAVNDNNLVYVKQLVHAGASVDMMDTENLKAALRHENLELIQILCENGAKLPQSWLESPSILLPTGEIQSMPLNLVACINRCLLNRRLRFAAASGDLRGVIQCQRLGANIEAMNWHGSTALLCAIEHGDYFPIVHSLVSCGASILHRNPDQTMSLIDLAESKQYDIIARYLTEVLNHQFLNSIISNDRMSAEQFAQLRVDCFNYQDEDKRTALHYAVQHHGIELVRWLCDRGSRPMHADVHGDYPITLAAQKGDYPVVELFILKYPGTKTQTNREGLTALRIAQKLKYRRIVQLIESGQPVEGYNEDSRAQHQRHTPEQLREAVLKGDAMIIREFCEDRYDSREEKRQLCYQLLLIAQNNKQDQIVDILEPYYNTKLKPDVPSDIAVGDPITLKEKYRKILFGILTGMGKVIADCSIRLDPNDPQTYRNLFSGLTSKLTQRLKQLKVLKNDRDAQEVYQQDTTRMVDKLDQISKQMQQLEETQKQTRMRIQERNQRLARPNESTALERKTLAEENEEDERQLAVLECSTALYQREQEAILTRQTALKFISTHTNLYLLYLTVESRLQYLFHSVVSGQCGELNTSTTMTKSSLLGFGEVLIPIVKDTLREILSKLDETRQRHEWYNLLMLGQIEEFNRLASDTAVIMTLYYKEQIQSIDNTQNTQAINPYSEQLKEIEKIFTDLPSKLEQQSPVLVVAEYVTAWIINALLYDRQEIKLDQSLPTQLWYLVAKKDLLNYGTSNKTPSIVRIEASQQTIPLSRAKEHANTHRAADWVQLRYLIGGASMVGLRGEIYQCDTVECASGSDLNDLDLFGYVYLSPFTDDENIVQSIVKERKMVVAVRNDHSDIVFKVDDIAQLVQAFRQRIARASPSHEIKEIAKQVTEILTVRKTFVNGAEIRHELGKARKALGLDVEALKENVQNNMKYYRDSLDATHQKIQQEAEESRKVIEKDNEDRYNQAINKLFQQFDEHQRNMESIISQRLDKIETNMETKIQEILTIAKTAKQQSQELLDRATQAAESSERSASACDQSKAYCRELLGNVEEQRKSLHSIGEECKVSFTTKINELQGYYEQNIGEMQQRLQQDFDRTSNLKKDVVATVKEAAKAAEDAKTYAKETKKLTEEQLKEQKDESKKLIAAIQEERRSCEEAVTLSKALEKQVARKMDSNARELERLTELCQNAQKDIARLEKLIKKQESK